MIDFDRARRASARALDKLVGVAPLTRLAAMCGVLPVPPEVYREAIAEWIRREELAISLPPQVLGIADRLGCDPDAVRRVWLRLGDLETTERVCSLALKHGLAPSLVIELGAFDPRGAR